MCASPWIGPGGRANSRLLELLVQVGAAVPGGSRGPRRSTLGGVGQAGLGGPERLEAGQVARAVRRARGRRRAGGPGQHGSASARRRSPRARTRPGARLPAAADRSRRTRGPPGRCAAASHRATHSSSLHPGQPVSRPGDPDHDRVRWPAGRSRSRRGAAAQRRRCSSPACVAGLAQHRKDRRRRELRSGIRHATQDSWHGGLGSSVATASGSPEGAGARFTQTEAQSRSVTYASEKQRRCVGM